MVGLKIQSFHTILLWFIDMTIKMSWPGKIAQLMMSKEYKIHLFYLEQQIRQWWWFQGSKPTNQTAMKMMKVYYERTTISVSI